MKTIYETIKEQVGITQIASTFNIPINKGNSRGGKRESCPLCGSHSGFITINNSYYKCFKCGSHGDIFNLLEQFLNVSKSQVLSQILKKCSIDTQSTKQAYKKNELENIYNKLKDNKEHDKCIEFFEKRMLTSISQTLDYGYYPTNYLSQNNYSKDYIQKIGLLSSNENELMNDRIIFPYFDIYGEITHVQGRALYDSDLRWISSINKIEPINQTFYNLQGLNNTVQSNVVALTEGVTDCLTAQVLGLTAISSCGIQAINYSKLIKLLDNKILLVIFDSDIDEVTKSYKSWKAVISDLISFYLVSNTEMYVWIPELEGFSKDLNEAYIELKNQGLDNTEILDLILNQATTIEEACFKLHNRNSISVLDLIRVNSKQQNTIYSKKVEQLIINKHGSLINYLYSEV
jgi:hypothetical protein